MVSRDEDFVWDFQVREPIEKVSGLRLIQIRIAAIGFVATMDDQVDIAGDMQLLVFAVRVRDKPNFHTLFRMFSWLTSYQTESF